MGEQHDHAGHSHSDAVAPIRVPRQEQEDASTEIIEVARGILRLQLPTDFTGLGHVNTYAIEDSRGFTLVDPGLPTDASWEALQNYEKSFRFLAQAIHPMALRPWPHRPTAIDQKSFRLRVCRLEWIKSFSKKYASPNLMNQRFYSHLPPEK